MDKPDALQLADELERDKWHVPAVVMQAAADELRRQHGEIKSMQAERLRSERRLLDVKAQRDALLEQRDELRRALEIIAVGDATNPQAQAAEELIALGYWRDIPEARAAIKTVEEKA